MRTVIYSLLLSLIVLPVQAQKELNKQWEAKYIDTLRIQSDALATVRIVNTKKEAIIVKATMQGDLSKEIMMQVKKIGRTLNLGTGLTPYFTPVNDKLAAHKVLSVDMEVLLPREKSLVIYSEYGDVHATGNYQFIEVGLENGNCILKDFKGDARLYTVNGLIRANCKPGVSGRALSKHGTTTNSLPAGYPNLIKAESINGDIQLITIQ